MKTLSAFFLTVFAVFMTSCSKGDTPGPAIEPSNLMVNASVSNDNSGNVTFTSIAENAVSYEYDFGNGIYQTVPTGIITYKYPASGTYTVKVTAKSSSEKTISKTTEVSVNVALTLIWSDEFNIAGSPDASKWGYDTGTGSGGWGNNELQYYTTRTENVSISNGTLKITAKKESFSGSNYTSARLLTKGKFSFKYGKIEVRAKLPAGIGTWPAIWMLGDNISTVGWPACGEIDVMEHRGSELNKVLGSLHHPGHSGGNPDSGSTNVASATSEFHTYSAVWSAANIKFYVDDVIFYTFNNAASLPFNHNFFIILNVAMGGGFGGPVDSAFSSASMEIDYVRVYQ